MEADLAFRGIDWRDFYAPGGGAGRISLRRAMVLLHGLPADSAVRASLMASLETAERERLASRRKHYADERARQEVDRD